MNQRSIEEHLQDNMHALFCPQSVDASNRIGFVYLTAGVAQKITSTADILHSTGDVASTVKFKSKSLFGCGKMFSM